MQRSVRVPLGRLSDDLREITSRIVWSTVSTTDRLGRPRCRVMHPVWTISPGAVTGVIGTRATPVKRAHLARSPWLTCAYWSPDHDAAFLDCHAAWATGRPARSGAWTTIATTPEPMGYDPFTLWPDGPDSADFAALLLTPHRIQVCRAADLGQGRPSLLWATDRPSGAGAEQGEGGVHGDLGEIADAAAVLDGGRGQLA